MSVDVRVAGIWLWDECSFSEHRVVASGIRRGVQLGEEFQISANGQTIDMVVMQWESGARWTAESRESFENHRRAPTGDAT